MPLPATYGGYHVKGITYGQISGNRAIFLKIHFKNNRKFLRRSLDNDSILELLCVNLIVILNQNVEKMDDAR